MILYFSATGNFKYVACRLSSALGQNAMSIVDSTRREAYSFTGDSTGHADALICRYMPRMLQ